MTTQTEIIQKNHRRAVRFFWCLLIGATTISLIGNVVHAMLPYIPSIVIQIGAAAVPPIALLAAVHGIALAVRAGASGKVYWCAVGAVAVIGLGAFTVSFLALSDLMQVIGYGAATGWIFPAIIDTTVAVCTLMLVALGDKPARRVRAMATSANAQNPTAQRLAQPPTQSTKAQVTPSATGTRAQAVQAKWAQTSVSAQPDPLQRAQDSAHTEAAQVDADLASKLIASGATTQPVETVIAVLAASREGASINAAAKASRINYRTAQRIVAAAGEYRERQLAVVS
jgi:ribosomal protein L18